MKKEFGLYAVVLAGAYILFDIIYYSILGAPFSMKSIVLLILLVLSLFSVFIKYRYNWIVVSLPFLFTTINSLVIFFSYLRYVGIFDPKNFSILISILLSLSIILYLFIKNNNLINIG